MSFKPKIDLLYGTVIWSLPVVVAPFLFLDHNAPAWMLIMVFFLCVMISFWMMNSTEYRIDDGFLIARCLVLRKVIRISDIHSVRKTNNIWSSYALSSERLEINFHSYDKIYISPLEEETFIAELQKENPKIEITK